MSDEEQREDNQAWRDEWIDEQVTAPREPVQEEPEVDEDDWQLYECSVTAD